MAENACAASSRKVLRAKAAPVSSTPFANNATIAPSPPAPAADHATSNGKAQQENVSDRAAAAAAAAAVTNGHPSGDAMDVDVPAAEEPTAIHLSTLLVNGSLPAASACAGVPPVSLGSEVASPLAARPSSEVVVVGTPEGPAVPLVNAGEEATTEGPSGGVARGDAGPPSSLPESGAEEEDAKKEKRASVFESLAALSRDPPLVFSGEVLRVLTEVEGEIEEGGGTGWGGEGGIGGYGPEMDAVVESLISLGR